MSETLQVTESAMASDSPRRPFQFRLWHLLLVMGILSVILAIAVPTMQTMRRMKRHDESRFKLRMIALGLLDYHDTWNSFPPAYTCDTAGRPAHSWRVLGHVFMGKSSFSRSYNFAEPWNGPNNSKLIRQGNLFRNRYDGTTPANMTNYVAVVGPGAIWPSKESLGFNDFADDMRQAVMIVEISHSKIHWMEPRDLPIEELHAWLDPKNGPRAAGGQIEGGVIVSVSPHERTEEYLPRDEAKERLRALLTPASDEAVRRPDGDP